MYIIETLALAEEGPMTRAFTFNPRRNRSRRAEGGGGANINHQFIVQSRATQSLILFARDRKVTTYAPVYRTIAGCCKGLTKRNNGGGGGLLSP